MNVELLSNPRPKNGTGFSTGKTAFATYVATQGYEIWN